MRTSKYPLFTLKEISKDTEVISHQLMLRAGLIRQVASGLYTFLPTGMRVLRKIEKIIRKEMNNIGAIEIYMPMVHPAEIWQKSGRWQEYGPELLRFNDRSNSKFVLAPTHEELITDIMRTELSSYKELPLIFYQIQTKFRDEARPRFGMIRTREFIMKDAYSFHINQESLQNTYTLIYNAYDLILKKLGLNYRVAQADSGSIGGKISHEFHVLANTGENIFFSSKPRTIISSLQYSNHQLLKKIHIPKNKNITSVMKDYSISLDNVIRTILVKANKKSSYKFIALLIRADQELNILKTEKLDVVDKPLTFASQKEVHVLTGIDMCFLGPIKLAFPLIADKSVITLRNFCAGANIESTYYIGINWNRDLPLPQIADICNLTYNSSSYSINNIKNKNFTLHRSIEVGHIFQIGSKYSKAMNTTVQNKFGHHQNLYMGCYGIGLSRIIAAIIEQHHDVNGIIWPKIISPFELAILPINFHKSNNVKTFAENIYTLMSTHGIDSIIDDRNIKIGVMLNDMELIGISNLIIISDRNLANNTVEFITRCKDKKEISMIHIKDINNFIFNKIKNDLLSPI
ncbi:MAG: proline--tRNA ligase [Candidatus Dasytiphilus stammeri]